MVDFKYTLKRFLSIMTVLILIAVIVPISQLNQQNSYNESNFISVSSEAGVRSYKLFNTFTINKRISSPRHAYIGGFPIGISLKTDGVIVENVDDISTAFGKASLKNHIQCGDMILSIGEEKINFVEDITRILDSLNSDIKSVNIKILRGKDYIDVEIAPLIEEFTGKFRLGLKVKDLVSGVGTMTFVKEDGSFGALGHPICNFSTGECLAFSSGKIYDCKIVGVNRGGRGRPGELKASLKNVDNPKGFISANNKYGIFGKMDLSTLTTALYEVGDRAAVTPGKAQIFTTICDETDFYDIEIIKASFQSNRNDKSMVIRVTDKRLLETTGGVVQGMSGSPIIQNNKLIGAVTHVFVNDPTKGYGIYMDWMY